MKNASYCVSYGKERRLQQNEQKSSFCYSPFFYILLLNLFAFFGLTVALSIIFSNTGLFGSLAEKGPLWYDF